jgi:hypothetical protein
MILVVKNICTSAIAKNLQETTPRLTVSVSMQQIKDNTQKQMNRR